MLSLTAWVEMLKRYGCHYSKNEISRLIKLKCLCSQAKILGMYQVDESKVWDIFIDSDIELKNNLIQDGIYDALQMESKYKELKYHSMWMDFRSNYRKKKR